MTRIAFISTMEQFPWGGSEALWSQAALRLAQRGATIGVNVVRHDEIPPQIQELEQAGCLVTRRTKPHGLLGRAMQHLAGDKSLRWLAEFRPDFAVISQGDNLWGYPWMAECARLGIPFATIAQMAYANLWPPDHTREEMARAHGAAKANFFVSEANRDLTRRQLAHTLPNAQVVRNPFNVPYDAAPAWPADSPTWKLACIGRLEPAAKGQDVLLEVLRQDKWRKRPIEVSLFGAGPNETSLRELAKVYDLANVRFAGFAGDIEKV